MAFQLLVGTSKEVIPLGATPTVIGRSRTADVRLDDPHVSRRHLELHVERDRVHVRVVDDAAPFVYEGRARKTAELGAGARFAVGDTMLSIVGPAQTRGGRTASSTRHGGIADEARALVAITDLLADLDAATDASAAELAVRRWATAELGATACKLGDEPPAFPLGDGRNLAFRFRGSPSAITSGLAALAARHLGSRLSHIARVGQIVDENRDLRAAAVGSAREFLGSSKSAQQVAVRIAKLARSDSTALILGESGTGKTFAARLIHERSPRAAEPLRIVNCAAIPAGLFEAELFGAERGAFSGAVAARVGVFEAVGKGTLVLDEIGELDAAGQAKLLHALEEKQFERVGSNKPIAMQARLIAATNRDLAAMVEDGAFRRDLYFRLSIVTLAVPPLRERGDDIALLAKRILADLAPTAGRRVDGFHDKTLRVLRDYAWPGNVRELRNVIEHALVLGDDPLVMPDDLPSQLVSPAAPEARDALQLPARLDHVEAQAIAAALKATRGNRTKAAAILGINRVTLQNKLGPKS